MSKRNVMAQLPQCFHTTLELFQVPLNESLELTHCADNVTLRVWIINIKSMFICFALSSSPLGPSTASVYITLLNY